MVFFKAETQDGEKFTLNLQTVHIYTEDDGIVSIHTTLNVTMVLNRDSSSKFLEIARNSTVGEKQ